MYDYRLGGKDNYAADRAAMDAWLVHENGVSIYAVGQHWTAPWMWPDRPPGDLGAAVCAAAVLVSGITAIAARGASESARD